MIQVLLVGGTGTLGSRIARHLVADERVQTTLLVRPASATEPARRAMLQGFVSRGARIIEGDLADADVLAAATASD